jgi:hypothetical protein
MLPQDVAVARRQWLLARSTPAQPKVDPKGSPKQSVKGSFWLNNATQLQVLHNFTIMGSAVCLVKDKGQ